MNRHLNPKRLSIALRELWQMNRTKIASIPLVMLLAFAVFYLWPTGIFFKHLFYAEAFAGPDEWIRAVAYENTASKSVILLLVLLYLVICTKPYLDKVNRSVRTNMLPISALERTAALTLFALGLAGCAAACFFIYDYALIHWFKSLYHADVQAYLRDLELPYQTVTSGTLFYSVPTKAVVICAIALFLLLPQYFLSLVFFRKYSILQFLVMSAGIVAALAFLFSHAPRSWWHQGPELVVSIPLEGLFARTLHVLLVVAYWSLAMGAFCHKLKEKEV